MAYLRCPQCQNVIEAPATGSPVCPRCGFNAPAPRAAPSSYGSAPPTTAAVYAPQGSQAPAPTPYGQTYSAAPPQLAAWGRPRSFWISFFLGIVTLGVYYYIWNYKVFQELDREHGERHAAAWFWAYLGMLILAIIAFLGVSTYVAATTPRGAEPETLLATLIFYPILLAATAIFLAYMFKEISRLERYRQTRGLPDGLAPVWFLLLYIFGLFLVGIPTIVAYYLLQKSINEVWWNVYTQRQIPWPL